jgi:hypothetical protein
MRLAGPFVGMRTMYPYSHATQTRSTGQGAQRSLDHERPQKNESYRCRCMFSWFHTTASRVRRCDAGGHPCGGSSGSYDQGSWVPLLGWRCCGGYRPQHSVGGENRHNISLLCEDAVTRNPQERPRLHTQRQRIGEGDATLAVGRRVAGAPATLVHAAGGAARPQSVASAGALGLMAIHL